MVEKWSKHLKTGEVQPALKKGLLRLYSMKFCTYAQRCLLVLDIKGVPYDIVNCDLDSKPEWLFSKSNGAKVPAIEFEDGGVLSESLLIADYLDEAYPEPALYPKDPRAKAADRLLVDSFVPIIMGCYTIFGQPNVTPEQKTELLKQLKVYEDELTRRQATFFGGSRPGMVDLMIWPIIERLPVIQELDGSSFNLSLNNLPSLHALEQAMIAHPVVQKSYLPPKVHTKYFEDRRSKKRVYDFDLTDLV